MNTFLSSLIDQERLEIRDVWYVYNSREYGRIIVKSCESCHCLAIYGKKGCDARRCKIHRSLSDSLTIVEVPVINRNKGCFKYQGEVSIRKSVTFST